jgi:tetratricopeptide (TPR) repeat protein
MYLGSIAQSQGQIEEAERLFQKSILFYREIGARGNIWWSGFLTVGYGLLFLGKFDEAHSLLEENFAIWNDVGVSHHLASWATWLGYAKAHLGQYEQAHARAQTGHSLFQERFGGRNAVSSFILGSVALAERAYAEARQLLEESVAVSRSLRAREALSCGLFILGYAERGLSQFDRARQHLVEALGIAAELGIFRPLLYGLPAAALLLADAGEHERAVEIYALACRYPFVANSCWFEDVAGQHLAEVAATLPQEIAAAARERGQARDLDATVAELLTELGA